MTRASFPVMMASSFLLILFMVHVVSAGNSCRMNSECGTIETIAGTIPVPCAMDRDAAPVDVSQLSDETIHSFESLCTAYTGLREKRKLCCNHKQVEGIIGNFAQPRQMLSRCPSAMYNFASFFCAMSCDPNQSSFLQVVNASTKDNTVLKIQLRVDPEFRDTFYTSMAGVSSTLGKAIDALCGDSNCNPVKLLKYLGKRDPGAFDIEYEFTNESSIPVTGKQCFESPSADQWPENPISCSCTDCPGRCIPPVDFDDGSERKEQILFTYDMILIGISVLVSLIAVSIAAYVLHRRRVVVSWNVSAATYAATSTSQLVPPEANIENSTIAGDNDFGKKACSKHSNIISSIIRFWCTRIVFRFPILTILFGIALVVIMSCGLVTLRMESDPVLLWSAADSRARIEKNFFDQNFGPFFRINTFIVSISDEDRDEFSFVKTVPDPDDPMFTIDVTFSGIFRKEFLREVLSIQSSIHSIPTLTDVCFKPVSGECMIQSPLNFFQSNDSRLDIVSEDGTRDYADHLINCMKNNLLMEDDLFPEKIPCMSEWGGPGLYDVVFGGFSGPVPSDVGKNYYLSNTTSFVVTLLLQNSLNRLNKEAAEAFEFNYLNKMHDYKNRSVEIALNETFTKSMPYNVSYYSERSVVDEIARQSSADAFTIALSYIAMFLYIAISLGRITSFVKAKVSLGFAGVAIVLTSVTSSIGFLSFVFGDSIVFNLIIIEVIPFLILAVGVDNIFLMVQSIERQNLGSDTQTDDDTEDVGEELADILSTEAGPSILISSASEAGCFFIGSLASGMPAVKAFATTAGLSLFILLILQFTVFLSFLYLDAKRERRAKNPDVCLWPFFLVWRVTRSHADSDEGIDGMDRHGQENGGGDVLSQTTNPVEEGRERCASLRDPCSLFVSRVIVPLVRKLHYLILFIWILSLLYSLHSVPRLSIGLDQETSVPDDSYVKTFFADQKEKMRVGPPLFFVLNTTSESSFDFSSPEYQNLICSSASCNQDSLGNIVQTNSLDQETSVSVNKTGGRKYISGHATSWLDEFMSGWITTENCCSVKQVGNQTVYCEEKAKECGPCVGRDGRLKSPDLFWILLPKFLNTTPSVSCPSGGKAAYSFTVNYDRERVKASYYSTYHLPCKNSTDFINSIQSARLVSDQIQAEIDNATSSSPVKANVFPYSIFYVFYEQYLRTWQESLIGISSSLLTVIVIVAASRVLKTWCNHLIFVVTMVSFMLHLQSGMVTSSIELNAVSLVNLIMSIGISVEFTSHFMIAFAQESDRPSDSSDDVVSRVLQTTGSSILSGITLTKLIGIIVLGFASSRIFSLYYFRFYLWLVLVGAVHGLVYLPSLCYLIAKRNEK